MRKLTGGAVMLALVAAAAAQAAEKTPNYEFDYAYPAEAARIAPLRAWLEADRAHLHAKLVRDAAAARADAAGSGFPFNRYQASRSWKVVTSTPRFLSLSGDASDYSGGAHGQYASLSLVWDKRTRQRLAPAALFVSHAAIRAAFGASWCAWLKGERARRNGGNAAQDSFSQCPPVEDLTVLLGSSDGRRINRIGFIADPYVAGSYAEGTYETTLPVTAAVLRAVKPAYRADFALR